MMDFETRKNEITTSEIYNPPSQDSDYRTMARKAPASSVLGSYQPKSDSKLFKSQYVNDSGKWTQKAVNDNFVDFDDYISDIQNETEQYLSFNNKPLKVNYNQDSKISSQTKEKTNEYALKLNDYTLKSNDYTLKGKDDTLKSDGYTLKTDEYKIDENIDPELVAFNPVKGIIDFTDKSQKEIQRGVWRLGAENYLRKQRGFETSAWMLEHALQDNPSDIVRGNDSRIAYLINNDKNYLDALDKAISESKDGTIDTDLEKVRFKTGDLYYSINKANVHVKGYKQDNGKWIIYAEMNDVYNFDEIQSLMSENGEFSFDIGLGTVANDVALVSQKLGAINPYRVKVQFYTTR